jgi:hypothetical protein
MPDYLMPWLRMKYEKERKLVGCECRGEEELLARVGN